MKTLKTLLAIFVGMILNATLLAQTTGSSADHLTFEAFETKLKEASPHPQIIDARTAEEFKLNHLKGAVQLDITDEAAVQQLIAKLDKTKPVFVYSINNGRSGTLVKLLRSKNFKEAYELPGGISKWIGSGRPVETSTPTGLTAPEYKKLLSTEKDKLVLVDIHSKYCGGCKKLVPILDEVQKENPKALKIVKIELFDNKALGKELNIQSIPTLILYKDGKVIWQKNGNIVKEDIEAALSQEVAQK